MKYDNTMSAIRYEHLNDNQNEWQELQIVLALTILEQARLVSMTLYTPETSL